jgi:UDP-glucose 4-epimerase
MKNILVTGGAGFIGSSLIKSLKEIYKNINIISLDNYTTGYEKNHIKDVLYINGNTWDIFLIKELQNFSPEFIFHFGEYSRIVQSFEEPDKVFKSNILGTQQILQYAIKNNSKLIYSGSSAIFGNNGKDQHLNPYSWTKSKNIELIKNYKEWYNLNFAILYFYNVYGNGQIDEGNYATVIGIFETQYMNNKPLTIVGDGSQSRCFTHIDDIVKGIIIVAEKGLWDGYYLSSKTDISIIDVAKLFKHPYIFIEKRRGERLYSDIKISKAETELGWIANVKLVNYIKDFLSKNN